MPGLIRNKTGKVLSTTLAPRSKRVSGGHTVNADWRGVYSNPPTAVEYLVSLVVVVVVSVVVVLVVIVQVLRLQLVAHLR